MSSLGFLVILALFNGISSFKVIFTTTTTFSGIRTYNVYLYVYNMYVYVCNDNYAIPYIVYVRRSPVRMACSPDHGVIGVYKRMQ